MKKHMVMFGVMAAGAMAVIRKRTHDIIKLRKEAEQQEIIEIEVETKQDEK